MEDGDDIYVYYFIVARTESLSFFNFVTYVNNSSFQEITKVGKCEVPIFTPCVKHGHVEN